jgi:hypothetical protein
MDAASFLRTLEEDFDRSPDGDTLRSARDVLDDPAFLLDLQEHLRAINDPNALAEILARVRRLKRKADDLCEERIFHKDIALRLGVTGGGGLVFASILGAFTVAMPALMLIPLVGGGWMTAMGYLGSRRLNEESSLYEHLAERIGKISEVIHA